MADPCEQFTGLNHRVWKGMQLTSGRRLGEEEHMRERGKGAIALLDGRPVETDMRVQILRGWGRHAEERRRGKGMRKREMGREGTRGKREREKRG